MAPFQKALSAAVLAALRPCDALGRLRAPTAEDPDPSSATSASQLAEAQATPAKFLSDEAIEDVDAPPITSFCWGSLELYGTRIQDNDFVKGAFVSKKGTVGRWDWKEEVDTAGGLHEFHKQGISLEHVTSFIDAKNEIVILTAGVDGRLQFSNETRDAFKEAGYVVFDTVKNNKQATSIGDKEFRWACQPGNMATANLSTRGQEMLVTAGNQIQRNKKVVIYAHTGDALIVWNSLHERFPKGDFVGYIHTS
mmetsp:Transcript_55267/g.124504  ORF Transcript_55267/g.124504 Transcript_55267/m.124504 type:complete len:252 (-) Transcript_55267:78-833(-)